MNQNPDPNQNQNQNQNPNPNPNPNPNQYTYTAPEAPNTNGTAQNGNTYTGAGGYNAYSAPNSYQYAAPAYQPPVNEKKSSGLAITSFIFGLLSLISCCFCFGCYGALNILFGVVAVILALVDRSKQKSFSGLALAGLICGIIGVILGVIMLVVLAMAFGSGDIEFNGNWEDFFKQFEEMEGFEDFYNSYGYSEIIPQ